MMADKISIDLTDQEQIILHSMNLVNLTSQITATMTRVRDTIPSLSSESAFRDLLASGDSLGLALYAMKAQEFATLAEVLAQHAQNTYEKMVDMDKALAVYVLNLTLNDPAASAADKAAIKSHPAEAVADIQSQIQSARKGAEQ